MKICFIADTVFKHGGVERVVVNIVNEISKFHDVDIICTKAEKIKNINKENIYNLNLNKVNIIHKSIEESFVDKLFQRIFNTFEGKISGKLYEYLLERCNIPIRGSAEFVKLINNNKYDVVIGVHGFYSLFIATISSKINSKTIGWQHSSYDAYFENNKHYNKMKILFQKYFDKLNHNIVLSKEDKIKYEKDICKNNCIIYNPISFSSKNKSDLKEKQIIAVGRLAKSKGFDLLIEAFSKFSDENDDWNLVILGDGKERESLEKLINNFGLNKKIKILGFVDNVKEYYLKSSMFISTSRWEGFGLAILEAMECGVPIIAFDNSGPSEIIDNYVNGILIERNNIDMLSQAIDTLANNKKIQKTLSQNALKRAKDFSIDSIIQKWLYIIN